MILYHSILLNTIKNQHSLYSRFIDSEYETFIGTYRGQVNNKYFIPYKNVL